MRLKRLVACILAGAMAMSVALTGCGKIDPEEVVATVGEKEITLGYFNFCAKFKQAETDAYCFDNYGPGMWKLDFWHNESSEDGTMEARTKKTVIDKIYSSYLLEDHMEEYGVEFTQEELDKIDKLAKEFMEKNSKKAIRRLGATEEYVKDMLYMYTLVQKMQEAIGETAEIKLTIEDCAQTTISYVRVANSDDKETQKTRMEKLEKFAKDMESEKADFKKIADSYNYSITEYSYGKDNETLEKEVKDVVKDMEEGEISGIIATEKANYIVRLDKEYDKKATEKHFEEEVKKQKMKHFSDISIGYSEEVELGINAEAYEQVKFNRLFIGIDD